MSLQRGFLGFFSQDLRVSDNLETNFYVTFSDWGFIALASSVNPYLKLTVRASLLLQIIRGVFFFFVRLRVQPEGEEFPCPPSVDRFFFF